MEGREGRVFPIILSQASAEDEEEDEDEDQCPRDVIRIGDMSDYIFVDELLYSVTTLTTIALVFVFKSCHGARSPYVANSS